MVLLLDDDLDVLKAIERLFRTQKISLKTTSCAQDALEFLKNNKLNIIISDYQMRGTNGIEFLKKVKEMHPSCIRIILTASSDPELFKEDLNNGTISKILTKPFKAHELVEEIKRLKLTKEAS